MMMQRRGVAAPVTPVCNPDPGNCNAKLLPLKQVIGMGLTASLDSRTAFGRLWNPPFKTVMDVSRLRSLADNRILSILGNRARK